MNRRHFVQGALAAGAAAWAGNNALSPDSASAAAAMSRTTPVTDFGAKGDGRADDTQAILRALDAGGGVLLFPRGTYRITRPIEIELATRDTTSIVGTGIARVVMDGAGPAFHFLGTHDKTADPGGFADQVWDRERLSLIGGIEIRGAHPDAIGLRLEKTMQATLTGLLVRRCRTGIHLATRNRNLVISHCHLYHNREIGVHFDRVNLHQAIIQGSHISYNARSGIYVQGGEIRNLQIVGNDIEYNYERSLEDCADVLFDQREEGTSGREVTIVGNTIQARPSPGGANVRLLGGDEPKSGGMIAITGNLIGNQTDNLHLDRCRNVSVSGNAIYSATSRTFVVTRSANVTLNGNSIDWNPDGRAKSYVDGIRIEDCDAVSVSDTILENCFQGSPESGGAIEVVRSRDVSISDCQVLDPRYRGVVLENATRCRVSGCHIVDRSNADSFVAAIEARGRGRDNWIDGNTLHERDGIPHIVQTAGSKAGVRLGNNRAVSS